MKRFLRSILIVFVLLILITTVAFADDVPTEEPKGGGFDEFGYNATAGIFVGDADGVDRVDDGLVWGDATYANDHLVMKWSPGWQEGKDTGTFPSDAWENNNWNGKGPDGSGEIWHYKIVQSDECKNGEVVDGVCVWGQFEIIQSQGVIDGEHISETKATPNGYGNNK